MALSLSLSLARLATVGCSLAALVFASGCTASSDSDGPDDAVGSDDNEVKVDTSSPEARRQYDANVAFATSYAARCTPTQATDGSPRPVARVLLTGFGRFMSIDNNATGRIISTLIPDAHYPETHAPPRGQVDPPEPQLSVTQSMLDIPNIGRVEVCAMILPVYWDLAAILIAKEAESFSPSFVMMNGVAGPQQPVWIELGATNRASKNFDGSNQLRPAVMPGEEYVKIIESASSREDARGNLLSWRAVETAAKEAATRHANEIEGEARFDSILQGARLAGFPRASNTYLCNNVTYVTGWLMSHPNKEVRLLRASRTVSGAPNDVKVKIKSDLTKVPRVFVHWPSELADKHHAAAADVMKSIIGAQLKALSEGDAPTVGDNALADPTLQGGTFF